MATKTAPVRGAKFVAPVGSKCHLCPKPASGYLTFTSPSGNMRSLWLCPACFRDTWEMLTTTEGK